MKLAGLVLLLSGERSYLIEARDGQLHTKDGIFELKELKRKKYGDRIRTHTGKEFYIVKPSVKDILEKRAKRLPQIMMPKDIASIIANTGVGADSLVVDAGTGSGFLAIFLAHYLSKGKVVTYEKDKKFAKLANENIKFSGLDNIKLKQKDVRKGVDEKEVDLVTLDMRGAEKLIKRAYKVLKPGGWLVVYSPCIEQVISAVRGMKREEFGSIKIVENIVREWQMEKYTRPKTLGLMHTGFLTFARKVG